MVVLDSVHFLFVPVEGGIAAVAVVQVLDVIHVIATGIVVVVFAVHEVEVQNVGLAVHVCQLYGLEQAASDDAVAFVGLEVGGDGLIVAVTEVR